MAAVGDAIAGEARLLCLDEMDVTDIADALVVKRLLERVLGSGCALVVTSNRAVRVKGSGSRVWGSGLVALALVG